MTATEALTDVIPHLSAHREAYLVDLLPELIELAKAHLRGEPIGISRTTLLAALRERQEVVAAQDDLPLSCVPGYLHAFIEDVEAHRA